MSGNYMILIFSDTSVTFVRGLLCVCLLNKTAVGNIDTSGISMMEEIKKVIDRRELKVT